MMNEANQNALAERLKGLKPGDKRDAELILHGFMHGVQAREEVKEQETKSA